MTVHIEILYYNIDILYIYDEATLSHETNEKLYYQDPIENVGLD